MSLLIYSPRCKHSMDVIEYINKHQQLKQLVHYHNINTQGIPDNTETKSIVYRPCLLRMVKFSLVTK